MKNKIIVCISCLLLLNTHIMAGSLPIDTMSSKDAAKPLLLYITGDGGLNSFSTNLVQQINSKGYPVVSLNAKSYFWKTKQPDVAAKDINALLLQYLSLWKRSEIILMGYSLGADVLPFIQAQLSPGVSTKIKYTVLLSPSANTDFTVHLFYSANGGSNVPDQINKITNPTLIIFGNKETDTPVKDIVNKLVTVITVAGDHHYNNNIAGIANEITKRIGS